MMTPAAFDLLASRRSVPTKLLGEPAPSAAQLALLLEAALRVPDHARLEPWRLIKLEGDARMRFGELIAGIHRRQDPELADTVLEKDRQRFRHAPLVLVVVAMLTSPHKVPEIEQLHSAGCVAYNLLLGAQALGFGAQWLTGWAAYDRDVHAALGLGGNERIVGFIHIGTPAGEVDERARPAAASRVSDWNGPPA